MSTRRLAAPLSLTWPAGAVTRRLTLIGLLATAMLLAAWALPSAVPDDFSSFVWSAIEAAAGRNAYTRVPITGLINLNPPISLILFQPLAWLDPLLAARLWMLSLPLQVGAALLVLRRAGVLVTPLRAAWALASDAMLWTAVHGQIYALLGLLATLAWADARAGRLGRAGVWLALLVAVKPHFALPLVLLVIAAGWRQWRAFLPAAAITAIAWTLPLAVYGPGALADWLIVMRGPPFLLDIANASLPTLLTRAPAAPLTLALMGLGMLVAAGWTWRVRPAPLAAIEAGLLVALLLAPISWPGYGFVALPVYLGRAWDRRWWPALILLSVPGQGLGSLVVTPGVTIAVGRLLALGAWLWEHHNIPALSSRRPK